MSLITIIWSMIASACLTLALVHGLIWCMKRTATANLLFALAAVATAVLSACEVWMMRAQTPEQFATALRWLHVPAWALIVALVGFVRLSLHAGRPWIAWTVCGLRTLSLILNFLIGANLNYLKITAVRRIPFLGERISVGTGVLNPWMLVGQLSLVLLVIFAVDAALTVWRRGDRRQALTVGGIVFFTSMATGQAILALWGIIPMPITASLFYMGIVAAMGFELSQNMLRAAELADELNESEQRMNLAAQSANLGLWMRDIDGGELWATEKCRALFGFTPEEPLTYGTLLARVHPQDREPKQKAMQRALVERCLYEAQYRVVLPDGSERWIGATGQAEYDAAGKPTRMLGVCTDITVRRRSEQETRELRQELAHASRVTMLGQLATALAHELSQPLGAILRNAEAAELFLKMETPDLDEVLAILADIRKDDQRAGGVIDRMRSLLKRRNLESERLDVAQLVGEVAAFIHADAAARHVVIETEVPDDLWPVRGDRVQIQQVLLNLILNGMDALNGDAGGERRVTVRARSDGAAVVEIAVSDTGHGIPEEKVSKLFEPFFTTKPQGMGIGLSISRTIIEAHGGSIRAENNAERGATFRVTLPVANEETAA